MRKAVSLFLRFAAGQKANQHKGQFIDEFEYESQNSGGYIGRQFEDGKERLGFCPAAGLVFLITGHVSGRSIDAILIWLVTAIIGFIFLLGQVPYLF